MVAVVLGIFKASKSEGGSQLLKLGRSGAGVEELVVVLGKLDHPHGDEHGYVQEVLLDEHHTDLFTYPWPV